MLTPRFTLIQDDDNVIITIFASFCQISETEINFEDNSFTFYSSPYYLRLTLPCNLVDSESGHHNGKYDVDQKAFVVECKKQTKGEFFPGLEMLTALLAPPRVAHINKPSIEVLSSSSNNIDQEVKHNEDSSSSHLNASNEGNSNASSDEENMHWFFQQSLPPDGVDLQKGYKYGFANQMAGVISKLSSELWDIVDIEEPEQKNFTERREERLLQERSDFSEEHYLADLFEEELPHGECLLWTPQHLDATEEVKLNETEKDVLLLLPRKEYLLNKEEERIVILSLVDILFAWAYNHRITMAENCSESAWNISKLSPTLSWLECYTSLHSVVESCMRRSLVYPLFRNWQLSLQVKQDTAAILNLGRKQVLKCLLETRHLFNEAEPKYLLNELYITDYCVWIQSANEDVLKNLATRLNNLRIEKSNMNLDLEELEAAGRTVMAEEEEKREREGMDKAEANKRQQKNKDCKGRGNKELMIKKNNRKEEENLNEIAKNLSELSVVENQLALLTNGEANGLVHSVVHLSDVPYTLPSGGEVSGVLCSSSDDNSDTTSDSDTSTDSADTSTDSTDTSSEGSYEDSDNDDTCSENVSYSDSDNCDSDTGSDSDNSCGSDNGCDGDNDSDNSESSPIVVKPLVTAIPLQKALDSDDTSESDQ